MFGWLKHAVQSAGRAVGTVTHAVSSATSSIASVAGKIPIVGAPLHATLGLLPFKMVDGIAHGQRIDRAVIGSLKDKLSSVQEIAPYAQTVISMVPGIGSGVNAAIAAGTAIAAGRPITQALIAGVRGAIPGGPIATSAFDTAIKVAQGGNVGSAVLDAARAQLPPAAQKAFDTGLAIAQGKKLQDVMVNAVSNLAPAQVQNLITVGQQVIRGNNILQAGRAMLPAAAQSGFDMGVSIMSHSGLNVNDLAKIRKQLSGERLKGFDNAVSMHIGMVARKAPPGMTAQGQAAFYLTHGTAGTTKAHQATIIKTVAHIPAAKQAIKIAASQHKGWWQRVKEFFTAPHAVHV